METQVLLDNSEAPRWSIAQLQPFIDVYKRARRQNGDAITTVSKAASEDPCDQLITVHMAT